CSSCYHNSLNIYRLIDLQREYFIIKWIVFFSQILIYMCLFKYMNHNAPPSNTFNFLATRQISCYSFLVPLTFFLFLLLLEHIYPLRRFYAGSIQAIYVQSLLDCLSDQIP